MNFYSTSKISRIYGLKAIPLIFDFLTKNGYIVRVDEKYRLTTLGESYGKMFSNENGSEWIVWSEEKFAPILQNLKLGIIQNHNNKFKLYHMTHLDNIFSIFELGEILSHNKVHKYIDISNREVNSRRSFQDPIYKYPIHDYVPLYFNVRNAMLYNVQNNYGYENIIIFEINKSVCLKPYVLFTYKNAAASDAKFFYDIVDFLDNANWFNINSYTWFDDPSNTLKKAMMSECLVRNGISITYTDKIHCFTERIANKVCKIINAYNLPIEVYYGSRLFFRG